MSGGASTPKAADLSGNIASGNATAAAASADAQQTLNTATQYNQNAQNNLTGVTNQANSSAGQLATNATSNLQSYNQNFQPLQSQEASTAANYGSTENTQRLQGQAVANVSGANQAAMQNSQAALAAEGVDPGSVHGAALNRQAQVAGAGQEAAAGTNSAINTQQQAFNMQNTANQLGMQVGAAGQSGASGAASVAEGGQQDLNSTNASGISNLTANTGQMNASTTANSGAVNAANTQFNEQQTAYQDQQQANSSALSSIGSIAGAAAMFMEEGGEVPAHTGALPVPGQIRFPNAARRPAHSGKPVNPNHFAPPSPQAVKFTPMFHGGSVTAKDSLPPGSVPGSTDRKPAILTPGEFVVPKDAVDHMGVEYWHKQVDKARDTANKRRAIPIMHAPHMSLQ